MRQRQMLFCIDEKHTHCTFMRRNPKRKEGRCRNKKCATLLLSLSPPSSIRYYWSLSHSFVSFQHAIGNRIIIINHLENVFCRVRSVCASNDFQTNNSILHNKCSIQLQFHFHSNFSATST